MPYLITDENDKKNIEDYSCNIKNCDENWKDIINYSIILDIEEILFDRGYDEPLFIYSRFVGMTII